VHFSGHGIKNNEKNFKNEYVVNKNNGDVLVLEDEAGLSINFFERSIKALMD